MRAVTAVMMAALTLGAEEGTVRQQAPRTLVAVFAHPDDEVPIGAVLARHAREGDRVFVIVATDGANGAANTTIPKGPELARARVQEMSCSTNALGINPAILLGYPDGELGNYPADGTRLYRLTQRLAEELERLNPDALITWGPDGGTGHADHRLIGNIVTQLVRAGARGATERLFYSYIAPDGARAINPARGAPPLLAPLAKHLTVRVPFTPADLEAARRSMSCHRTQYGEELVQRVLEAARQTLNGVMTFAPAFPTLAGTELFPPH